MELVWVLAIIGWAGLGWISSRFAKNYVTITVNAGRDNDNLAVLRAMGKHPYAMAASGVLGIIVYAACAGTDNGA